jgi:hypothetical protein
MDKNNHNQSCECSITEQGLTENDGKQKTLNIKWQRLITKGETCSRCGSTEQELDKAIDKLKQALTPLGIEVKLEKEKISILEFKEDPLQSNRIWINEQPIEDFIKGNVGESPCCDVCGPSDCRTVEIDGKIYETVPADLIIQAGLMAANYILNSKKTNSCC